MKIFLNGEPREIAEPRLAAALGALGYDSGTVATALNGAFIPAARREATELAEGDRLEVVSPRQGG